MHRFLDEAAWTKLTGLFLSRELRQFQHTLSHFSSHGHGQRELGMENDMKRRSSQIEQGITYAHFLHADEESATGFVIKSVTGPVVYTIGSYDGSRNCETRGHREMLRRQGKEVPQIKKRALSDKVVILPGVDMSAADVVSALRRCIEQLEEDGMFVGEYEGASIIETIDGQLKYRR